MRPKILLTARIANEGRHAQAFVNTSYIDAVHAGGGTCAMLPYTDAAAALDYARTFDGLLITGGDDVDPRYYNEAVSPLSHAVCACVDDTDLLLIEAFHQLHKPIFGICRGIQILNVAFQGSLIQDIHAARPDIAAEFHTQSLRDPLPDSDAFAHEAVFKSGTLMHDIFGDKYPVNSYHHQALKKVPDFFTVTATSPDGIIEAIESRENIFGVQWHPERLIKDERHLRLFSYFVELCKTGE